jgi:hypothetical protein
MKIWLAAAAVFLCGAASAHEVNFQKDVAEGEHVTGTVDVDDSSGEINGVTGDAKGVVSGSFTLDPANRQAEIAGQNSKLVVTFDRRNQSVTAELQTCADGACSGGKPVEIWVSP